MKRKILATLKNFTWRQWLVVALLLLAVGLTGWHAFRTARDTAYWRQHRDEPIRGWMTIGYVAHSYHVPPHVLSEALGLPPKPPDRRPLRVIAKAQNRSMDEVRDLLQAAIARARPPNKLPPPPGNGGKP